MLVNKLEFPQMCNKSDYVLLANHTLKQLNIIGDGNGKGKINSVKIKRVIRINLHLNIQFLQMLLLI